MMPLVDGKTCFAAIIPNIKLLRVIFSILLLPGFAILAPRANAQLDDHGSAEVKVDSVSNGQYRSADCSQNTGNLDLLEFSGGNIVSGTPESENEGAGSVSCPPHGNSVASEDEGGPDSGQGLRLMPANEVGEDSKSKPAERPPSSNPPDFNQQCYYKNKLEFAFDAGWLPLNIPFPFDVFEGDSYDLYPLRYTLVPVVASLRWQLGDVGSRWIFRGNWDMTFSASATAIPKGAETHYFSYDMGIRRNFVPRNPRVSPYVDIRVGLGVINAKGPLGVYYAQGQNFTFTLNLGSGVRYNFNPRYAVSAGLNWMHISNNNLSAPGYSNYGINVYGPMFGLDIQLGKRKRHVDQ
jgi:hypothetical protein